MQKKIVFIIEDLVRYKSIIRVIVFNPYYQGTKLLSLFHKSVTF